MKSAQRTIELVLPETELDAAWASYADTDRFNRVAGMGIRYPEGSPAGQGVMHLGLVSVSFEERPTRFLAPRFVETDRRPLEGPMRRMWSRLALERSGSDVRVRYTLGAQPRSWLGSLLAPLVLWLMAPRVRRALRQLKPGSDGLQPPPLRPDAQRWLRERGGWLASSGFGERLERYLSEAPLRHQEQMEPRSLVPALGEDVDEVLTGLLRATREGLLELRWRLACPSCRGQTETLKWLDEGAREVHCDACGVVYDSGFADAVVVQFRPVERLRQLDLPLACAGSPARSPGLRAREVLDPRGELPLTLALSAGRYQLRIGTRRHGLSLRPEAPRQLLLEIDERGELVHQGTLCAAPGGGLVLRSRLDRPVVVALEGAGASGALTAGELLQRADARALLPAGLWREELLIGVARGVVVALHSETPPPPVSQARLARWACGRGSLLFPDLESALEGLPALAAVGALGLALGPVVQLRRGGETVPAGEAARRAFSLVERSEAGRIAVDLLDLAEPAVRVALSGTGWQTRRAETLDFDPAGTLGWLERVEPAGSAPQR